MRCLTWIGSGLLHMHEFIWGPGLKCLCLSRAEALSGCSRGIRHFEQAPSSCISFFRASHVNGTESPLRGCMKRCEEQSR